jgi:putative RNA 2'-phosphotransferase
MSNRLSRFLSLVLRHKPEIIGLKLNTNGWVDTDNLVSAMKSKETDFNFDTLDEIVRNNDKKRFEYNTDKSQIRACQGHSQEVDLDLKPINTPDVLYHGTVKDSLDAITITGLFKMTRNHVHLSKDMETAKKVGGRRGTPIILEVDAKAMINDGHIFYVSTNGVYLTNHVPPKYITITE